MGEAIELTRTDGASIGAYKVLPEAPPKGGIVVVQEIFGVNAHIRSVADRFAAEGYAAIAPAIFDPAERGVELAYDAEGMKRGSAIAQSISPEQYGLSIDAAIAALAPLGAVGIVGFCLGGSLAYRAASDNATLAAAVCYYGGRIAQMADATLRCPVEMHFGEKDDHIPMSDVAAIRAAHPEVAIYTYPAGHGFNCDVRASYDKPSADLAWRRTLEFLHRTLRGQPA